MTVGDERQTIEAAELAIGLLDADEHSRATRLAAIDPDFADDVSFWENRLALQSAHIPPLDAPPDLFGKIEARLDADALRAVPACEVTRHGAGSWIDWTSGARIKVLHAIPALNRRTLLLELAPGALVDTHAHDVDEECYVISGDIAFGGEELSPGDFHLAPAGSRHGLVSSRGGCLCLIVTSM